MMMKWTAKPGISKPWKLILLAAWMAWMCLFGFSTNIHAHNDSHELPTTFKDVPDGHWAGEAIRYMTEKQIIAGYPDGYFKPDKPVTRAEFAKIMVLALNLPLYKPDNATFEDLPRDHWAYKYVETAKFYLTGFRNAQGDFFKPHVEAVREDMAVALVKVKELDVGASDMDLLNGFADQDQMSPNLLNYIAAAVKAKIMVGYPAEDGKKTFRPQDHLTRAQAAQLLYTVMPKDEKVTYEDDADKVTYDDADTPSETPGEYIAPVVSHMEHDGKIKLLWQVIEHSRLEGYKVVVSKHNDQPKYPEDAYLYWITNPDENRVYVYAGLEAHGGDVNGKLQSGETYYFSVTAKYEDGTKVAGNAVRITLP